MFDLDLGIEVLKGLNGNPDPFVLNGPSLLDVGVMGHCHNNCAWCYQGSNKQDHMTIENFKMIVDQCKHMTNQIALGGRGDPNLHPDFKEMLQYCRDNQIAPNYTTSGNMLTDEQIEASKLCGAVAVSMYNMPFTFSALKRLMEHKIKTNIHFVVTSSTLSQAISLIYDDNIWRRFIDLDNLNAIIFLLFKPVGKGVKYKHLSPNLQSIEHFAKAIQNQKCKFKIGMDTCMMNKISQVRELTPEEELMGDTCESARMSAYISPDMVMKPCSFSSDGNYVIVTKEQTIEQIWKQSSEFEKYRKLLLTKKDECPIFKGE